ncbi:MAG: c-type cytochrome [Bacteroidetes bacterium]|nr:c-type cytochrome [Bacteroidota bacterium]
MLTCCAALFSCNGTEPPIEFLPLGESPEGFPDIEFPDDNRFSSSRWKLGKKLFYDPILSSDSSIGCFSCHNASLAFSDDKKFSFGVNNAEGKSNAPTLTNVAYHPYFNRDGGVPTLEMQVLVPIQEHNELNNNIVEIAEKLKGIPEYVEMAKQAYNREPDAFVITRALATFERTLVSGNSPYDYVNTGRLNSAMTRSAKRGMELFFDERSGCINCHSGSNFTNYSFENNGLYKEYADSGRMRITGLEEDRAKFKVPTLRNVELTAPYMHDGSMQTLEEVVRHYSAGGNGHINQSPFINSLLLSEKDIADMVEFLKSLTDMSFTTNANLLED